MEVDLESSREDTFAVNKNKNLKDCFYFHILIFSDISGNVIFMTYFSKISTLFEVWCAGRRQGRY